MPAFLPKPGGGMIAIDTNLIVRYLTADHATQRCELSILMVFAPKRPVKSHLSSRRTGLVANPFADPPRHARLSGT